MTLKPIMPVPPVIFDISADIRHARFHDVPIQDLLPWFNDCLGFIVKVEGREKDNNCKLDYDEFQDNLRWGCAA
jgi:hypothetical protein